MSGLNLFFWVKIVWQDRGPKSPCRIDAIRDCNDLKRGSKDTVWVPLASARIAPLWAVGFLPSCARFSSYSGFEYFLKPRVIPSFHRSLCHVFGCTWVYHRHSSQLTYLSYLLQCAQKISTRVRKKTKERRKNLCTNI